MNQKTKDYIGYGVFSFVAWTGLVLLIMFAGCSFYLALWIAIAPLLVCEIAFLFVRDWWRGQL